MSKTGTRDASLRPAALVAWFAAAAAVWSLADLGQVRATIGELGFRSLAALCQVLYLALGAASGAAYLGVRRWMPDGWRRGSSEAALAIVGWGVIVAVAYANIVHLPSIASPSAIAVNAVLLIAGIGIWRILARLGTRLRPATWALPAALVFAILSLAGGYVMSAPRASEQGRIVARPPQAGADKPDIFVIAIDTLRFDHTGLTPEASAAAMPHLVALAERGTSFERAYAQASWTKPSVASLMTSLYPSTHGANMRRDRLPAPVVTLPELLQRSGYTTAVFSANPWISPAFGFNQGVGRFYETEHESFTRLVLIVRLLKLPDRLLPGRAISAMLRRLEDLFGVRQPKRSNWERDIALADLFEGWLDGEPPHPRFAYLHLMSPHMPYGPAGATATFPPEEQLELLQSTEPLPPARERALRELYAQSVAHADRVIGRLLDALESRGMLKRAVVVVTSDHGEEFHEHGHWGHGKSLYDELIHVPLVIAGPGIPAGHRASEPVMLVDILPTIARIGGAEAMAQWEGRDLSAPVRERPVYAELVREGGFASFMVYLNGRKYLETVAGLGESTRYELYDLGTDRAEHVNLAGDRPADPWHARIAQLREAATSKQVTSERATIDEDAGERLRALGYVN